MHKNIYTPREQLVCGKLDVLEDELRILGLVDLLDLAASIRHDCERMEAKLVARKDEEAGLRAASAASVTPAPASARTMARTARRTHERNALTPDA